MVLLHHEGGGVGADEVSGVSSQSIRYLVWEDVGLVEQPRASSLHGAAPLPAFRSSPPGVIDHASVRELQGMGRQRAEEDRVMLQDKVGVILLRALPPQSVMAHGTPVLGSDVLGIVGAEH